MKKWIKKLDNANERLSFVKSQLKSLPRGCELLDAGCGSQQYRKYCDHLKYYGQDFGQYINDDKKMIGAQSGGAGGTEGYLYGELDYVGDIWNINEKNEKFDAILCTEVFEHIPYPIETLKEFSRLLKPSGTLILTAPSACLRHYDPYFFYSGFSDRWYERFLTELGFKIELIEPVGDYYSWLGVEMARTGLSHGVFAKIILFPAFLYFFNKKKSELSVSTLCMGYHVVAKKL